MTGERERDRGRIDRLIDGLRVRKLTTDTEKESRRAGEKESEKDRDSEYKGVQRRVRRVR